MARPFQRAVTPVLLLIILGLGGWTRDVRAQSNAEFFKQIVSGAAEGTLLAGPTDFTLIQEDGLLSVSVAGVDVADFVAHGAFTNPAEDDAGWDYGFQFRTTGTNDDYRIFVTSEGTWNFSVGIETPQQTVVAPALDVTPGATNALDVIVAGDQALFGINGQFVGTINLPELAPRGDVYASTGFLADLVLPGRAIALSEFTVTALLEESPAVAGTRASDSGRTRQPRPVTLVSGTCVAPGAPVQALLEATYPLGERQGSPDGVVAETSFTRAPVLLAALLAEPHAIMVSESFESPEKVIACADLGGISDEIGGFVIALNEQGSSRANGIVYLSGDDDLGQTNISVFLVPGEGADVTPGTSSGGDGVSEGESGDAPAA